jgi:hypothetical protein
MKKSFLSVLAFALPLTVLTSNQAQASSGGYVFKCGLSYSVANASYSGKAESFEFSSTRISNDDDVDSEFAETFSKVIGGLKVTAVYADDQIISVSVEDLKSGIITKGKSSVALYDTKANKSYELGCGQKVYTTTNSF